MSPTQQILLGAGGGAADPVYADDIYAANVYVGDGGTSRTITTGIDLATDGGMTWLRDRDANVNQMIFDTVRGGNKPIVPSGTNAQSNYSSGQSLTGWTTTGFNLGTNTNTENWSNYNYINWNFKKSKGFFDIVTWTGNGANRQISHNLKCVPGCILVKRTDTTSNWAVYHRSLQDGTNPEHNILQLDNTNEEAGSATAWNNSAPTDSVFYVGTHARVNANTGTYVAYLFGGGESPATAARSVKFGSNYHLNPGTSSDFTLGTGDYTIEFWWKQNHTNTVPLFDNRTTGEIDASVTYDGFYIMALGPSSGVRVWWNNEHGAQGGTYTAGKWNHCAVTRSSNVTRIFINGELVDTESSQTINCTGNQAHIGGNKSSGQTTVSHMPSDTYISNFRLVKGTARYTFNFTPSTEPLTNVTNTKLLCCQGSTTTAATVAPNTITAQLKSGESGTISASPVSPFYDQSGYIFGENADSDVIKCGGYHGNNSTTGPIIDLGWEPQWVMIKRRETNGGQWLILDSLRGVNTGGTDQYLYADNDGAEGAYEYLEFNSRGFQIKSTSGDVNNTKDYVYIAIRRPDGYCGKVPAAGTDAFAIDTTGSAGAAIPNFTSNFPVDFAFTRVLTSGNAYTGTRLTSDLGSAGKYMFLHSDGQEGDLSMMSFDHQSGWGSGNFAATYCSWMWKRGPGFDVVPFTGVSGTQSIYHNLGRVPEMFIVKRRDNTGGWLVYHKGFNGGTTPEQWRAYINSSAAADQSGATWSNVAPTSTKFTTGTNSDTGNVAGSRYLALLFASISGISKVGSYVGTGGTHTVTLGFQPRMLLCKNASNTGHWVLLDTARGWASGNDNYIRLDTQHAEDATIDWSNPTSTGFQVNGSNTNNNTDGDTYVYYAHA